MIGAALDVLVVSPGEVAEAAELAKSGLSVERSDSLVAALVRLRSGGAAVAVAVSDVVGGREREAFSALRAAGAASVVAVYPPQLAWMAPRALQAGADESLVQPAPPGAFELRVTRLARNAHELRRMRELASTDGLTGLANRRQFEISLERELQRAKRYRRSLTLGIFDVDHFKKYNDSCGHQAGDAALASVGSLLKSSLREVDIVARYGGEEFAVILPETAAHPGAGVSPFPFLERLRARVEGAHFAGEEKLPGGRLTISGGIACFPADASTRDELVAEADRALYAAKGHGRNVVVYRGNPVTA